jgi:hypothetical protein
MDPRLLAALIAFFGVIAATLVNLYWNFRSAKSTRKLPFLQKQLELCFEASAIASKLATTEDRAEWNSAHSRFLELFFGPLVIVEDDEVASAMVTFRNALVAGKKKASLPREDLQFPSLDLSAALRKLLLSSWKIQDLNEVLEAGRVT